MNRNHCPFCILENDREILAETTSAYAIFDKFPISKGHVLIIPRQHISDYFDLPDEMKIACWQLVDHVQKLLFERYKPDGFNVGINIGIAAGQTISHVHIHLIPRYQNDVRYPKGGIRHLMPGKGDYPID